MRIEGAAPADGGFLQRRATDGIGTVPLCQSLLCQSLLCQALLCQALLCQAPVWQWRLANSMIAVVCCPYARVRPAVCDL
jgi:hypothetical protein